MQRITTLLVNLGTPAAPRAEEVRVFLREFLSDPQVIDFPAWLWQPILRGMVLRKRPARVAELYESIWYQEPCSVCPADGCSPLECGTRRIARAVRARMTSGHRLDWCYRYGERSIENGIREAIAAGSSTVRLIPLFPQRTCSTTGSIVDEARRVASRIDTSIEVVFVPPDSPGFVEGLAARVRDRLAIEEQRPEHLLISFHGIPRRYDRREGGLYRRDCERTTEALLGALEWPPDDASLCFQSKFGPERWLEPATADLIESLPGRGVRRLAVVTPGFVTEGLETLEEIGQQGAEAFREAGGERFVYLPAVEDHPDFVRDLAALADTPFGSGPGDRVLAGTEGAVRT